jgi:hypothetical protein
MATPTTIFQDGPLPHGSFNVTILETAQAYIASGFTLDFDSKHIQALDATGLPDRQKVIPQFQTGSADFQFDDVNIGMPNVGTTFAVDANQDGTVEPYIVIKPGRTFSQDDMFKGKATIAAAQRPCIYFSNGANTGNLASSNGVALANTNILTVGSYLPQGQTLLANGYAASGLPTGLSIAAGNGTVTGTPTAIGAFAVTITSLNQSSKKGSRSFTWTIS